MRFANFLAGGFITAIVVNPLERKLAKRTSMHCVLIAELKARVHIVIEQPSDSWTQEDLCKIKGGVLNEESNKASYFKTGFQYIKYQ